MNGLRLLDLAGTCAFALNGALIGLHYARLDIVGVITLGLATALGGGMLRDVLIGQLPPATLADWRYIAIATAASLIVFAVGTRLERLRAPIDVFDALGLSFFCVTGAHIALNAGLGPDTAALMGTVTAVGGGTIRDLLVTQVPKILVADLYAIPALLGASLAVLLPHAGASPMLADSVGAASCLFLRLVSIRFNLHAPHARFSASEYAPPKAK